MFTGPAGMYSIRLWISLVNGVALPLTSCDKSLNNGSMEMECGDKCGTCRESETSTWRLSEQKMCRLSLCCTCRQNNYFINNNKKNGDGAQVQHSGCRSKDEDTVIPFQLLKFSAFLFFTKEVPLCGNMVISSFSWPIQGFCIRLCVRGKFCV